MYGCSLARIVSCSVVLVALQVASFARAQEAAPAADPAAAFQTAHAKWEEIDKKLTEFDGLFREASPADREKLREGYVQLVTEARKYLPVLAAAAEAAYQAAPNQDKQVTEVLLGVTADALRRDDYDVASRLSKLLVANKCDTVGVNNLAGMAAYCTDDFDAAQTLLTQAEKESAIGQEGLQYLDDIPEARKRFAVEQELRKKEAAADDLPRVRLQTNKGTIVVELFENEAPEAVGNFVSLVEKGFYNGLTFHRVLPGFMAQGGCPEGTGTGGPGYQIRCECHQPNHRNHFRGTLSMAHAGKDTGGSQFFITFLRTPHLDERHTAFGRVVEGMEVLTLLQRRDPQRSAVEPDKIVKAEVVRKRDHKYEPKPVE